MAKTRDPDNEIVRSNLLRFRKEAGLTTDQTAIASGVPVDNLRRYESGKSGVPASVLHQLAEIYGHAMDDFFMADPPKADLANRPAFFLKTLPNTEIDEDTFKKLQEIIDKANRDIRSKKKPAKKKEA